MRFYVNYTDKAKWKMPGVITCNRSGHDVDPEIYTGDFVKTDYKSNKKKKPLKIEKTKSELGKQIDKECMQIADKLIDSEIRRICNMNKKIQEAKATLSKYGTELIRGY